MTRAITKSGGVRPPGAQINPVHPRTIPPQRSLYSRMVNSPLAHKILPDRALNVLLAFTASMTTLFLSLSVLSGSTSKSNSAQAAIIPSNPPATSALEPTPSFNIFNFGGARSGPATPLEPVPYSSNLSLTPAAPTVPDIQKPIPSLHTSSLGTVESGPLQMGLSPDVSIERSLRDHISTMPSYDRALREFIFHAEGIRSCQYKCTANKRTIGIGFNLDVEANRITFRETIPCDNKEFQGYLNGEKSLNAEQVIALFEADLAKRMKILNNKFNSRGMDFDKLPPGAKITLVSLCINNPGLVGEGLLGYIQQKDWKNAACEIALRCNVKKDPRLRVRRYTEAATFLKSTTGQDLSLKMLSGFRQRSTPLNPFDVEGFQNFQEQWPAIQNAIPTAVGVSDPGITRLSSAMERVR